MTSVRRNLAASFFGRGWSAALQFVLVPVYLKLLGAEAFALVGFYALLFSVIARLDLGLSTTLNRELARAGAMAGDESINDGSRLASARDLLRTMEVVYVGVALIAGLIVWLAAPWIASRWLHGSILGEATIAKAVALMGMVVAAQWPISLYEGGLRGLERQTLLNSIGAVMTTLRGVGAVVILLWVSRTIAAYFIWQAVVNVVHVLVLSAATWRAMPHESEADPARRSATFRMAELSRIWRFTAALSGISVLGLVLTQADKVVLSKMLPLASFAYYNVAWSVAAGLLLVSVPLFEAIFPRLSALTAAGATDALRRTYHASIQLSALLAVPAAAVLLVFSRDVALVWLRDAHAAEQTHRLIGLLAIGTAVNVVMTIPFALQLATGWTRLSLYKNTVALVVAVPLLLAMVARYGALGAATVWIVINAGYLLFELPIMHRRLLPGALSQVYLRDIGAPSLLAIGAALATRALATAFAIPAVPAIAIAAVLAQAGAVAVSPLAIAFAGALSRRRASSVAAT